MLISTVLTWLLVAIGFVVALPALWLLSRALWPERFDRGCEAARRGLFPLFLMGLLPTILGVLIVVVLGQQARNGGLAALAGGLLLTWGWLGASGIAAVVGERLWPHLHMEPWRQTKHGGVVLVCCALLPVAGWFVLLPLLAILGWGVNVRTLFSRKKSPAPSPSGEHP